MGKKPFKRGVLTVPRYWNSFAVKLCITETIQVIKKYDSTVTSTGQGMFPNPEAQMKIPHCTRASLRHPCPKGSLDLYANAALLSRALPFSLLFFLPLS